MTHLLFISIINLTLTLLLLLTPQKKLYHYCFTAVGLCLSFWVFSLYQLSIGENLDLWGRLVFAGPIVMPASLLLFIIQYPKKIVHIKPSHFLPLLIVPALLLFTVHTNFIVQKVTNAQAFVYGTGHLIFAIYFYIYMTTFSFLAIRGFIKYKGGNRLKMKYLLIGFSFPALFASFTNLILPLFGNDSFIFYGPLLSPLVILSTIYSILKHRLMDIRLIISSTIATTLTLAGVLSAYLILHEFLILKTQPQDKILFITILFWVAICLIFPWLKSSIQTQSDKRLLKGHFLSQELLEKFSQGIAEATDVNDIICLIWNSFKNLLGISHIDIFLLDTQKPNEKIYNHWTLSEASAQKNNRTWPADDPLINLILSKPEIVYLHDAPPEVQKKLQKYNYEVCIPCMSYGQITGLLFLGAKKSDNAYTTSDFSLFKTIAAQIAISLDRIKPFEDIKRNYEQSLEIAEKVSTQASFATLTRGIAHEIRNPMGMILSGMELIIDNIDDKKTILEYAEMVKKSILRLSDITNTMLKYGSPVSKNREAVDMNDIIKQMDIISEGERRKKNIKITHHLGSIPTIEADPNAMSQVILNVVLNSMQAISENGTIDITTEPYTFINKNQKETKGIKIVITDDGPGIPESIQTKIYDPFFSTKHKNTGLGLSLVLRIINEHEGIIDIQSKENEGTQFTLTLPLTPEELEKKEQV